MSLDIYLKDKKGDIVYEANITHNLGEIAKNTHITMGHSLYKYLWRADEMGIKEAKDLINPLHKGLKYLLTYEKRLKKYEPENGWGTHDKLVLFVFEYLRACHRNPKANIEICR